MYASYMGKTPPSTKFIHHAVAFVKSNEEVAEIVKSCVRHRIPVIPFSSGTSLEGHIAALHGGISLDLSRMNHVLEVNENDLDCLV